MMMVMMMTVDVDMFVDVWERLAEHAPRGDLGMEAKSMDFPLVDSLVDAQRLMLSE